MAKVACIGAGLVGSAWAVVFARGGMDVAIYDIGGVDAYEKSRKAVAATLSLLEASELLSEPPGTIEARVRYADSIADAVSGVVHVQESVKEDVAVKRATFLEIERHAPADAVLASSTSAIMGSQFLDIETGARALVAHPVNPPSLIPLVELCGTPKTSADTVARTRAFMTSMGMKPVTLNREIDGFLLNRLQYTLVAEALHLVGEGYCSAADIDRVVTDGLALRWATIGPFEVAHLNSPGGFQGFVDHLGGMMRHMGRSARTDYDWPADLAGRIHREMLEKAPIERLAERQRWRDANIVATRAMQRDAESRSP
ncbi:3-hydroxyacyl-CoA dehydrogenase [Ensifer soli]|uniref:3-hydroxyacyl-CoA dehydrogenase n=1 Tax=Ciceribacter sp. sgz301302 TaxID=3342379 RepID=UPI0035B7CE57